MTPSCDACDGPPDTIDGNGRPSCGPCADELADLEPVDPAAFAAALRDRATVRPDLAGDLHVVADLVTRKATP